MQNISRIDAWTLWFVGDLPLDAKLWGMRVFWWGRLGKITEFVAAVTVEDGNENDA
jgi:hypothetical protein